MWSDICLLLFLVATARCSETEPLNNTTSNNTSSIEAKSDNVTLLSKEITTERIIQPSSIIRSSSSDQATEAQINSPANVTLLTKSTKSSQEFRPSPQLENYYEFNRFPVVPAFPEARLKSWGESSITQHHHHHQHQRSTTLPSITNRPTTDDHPWVIKFPSTNTPPPQPTAKDRPYEFYQPEQGKSFNFNNNQPSGNSYNIRNKNFYDDGGSGYKNHHKFDFNQLVPVPEKPSAPPVYFHNHQHNFEGGLGEHREHQVQESGGNHWKKIIKLLTAFIPIGLLISALTPTVITVQNVNQTSPNRLRAEDDLGINTRQNRLVASSLSYFKDAEGCQDRILCELLVSASNSQDAEQHVSNLLDNFITEDGRAVERTEDIKRVFEAVRRQNCLPIICRSMKENT